MEAMLAHATPPQDEVQNGEPDGESVHLSFGYGSDLTQFSDRVIRVHVVQDDDQDEASFGTRLKETIVGQTHAGLDVTATRANDQFVDLEMQSTGRATVEKERKSQTLTLLSSKFYFAFDCIATSLHLWLSSVLFTSSVSQARPLKSLNLQVAETMDDAPRFCYCFVRDKHFKLYFRTLSYANGNSRKTSLHNHKKVNNSLQVHKSTRLSPSFKSATPLLQAETESDLFKTRSSQRLVPLSSTYKSISTLCFAFYLLRAMSFGFMTLVRLPSTSFAEGWSYDIPISSLIVAAHSVYFKKMLTSGLQESRTKDKPIEVTLSPQGVHTYWEAAFE